MKFELQNKKVNQIQTDFEVILVVNKNLKHKWIRDQKFLKEQKFKGEAEEFCYLPHENRMYLGVNSLEHEDLREAAAKIFQVTSKKYKSIKIGLYGDKYIEAGIKAFVEGIILSSYSFDKYKTKKSKYILEKIIFSAEAYDKEKITSLEFSKNVKEGEIIAMATNYVRDIVNTIPAEITPVKMAKIAQELGKKNKIKVQVFGEEYLKREGMGAFLAVSKASPYPPQLIHITYKPVKAKKKIVLVGKGLTYDSGGLSLKPSNFMTTMKSDKSGGAAVLGIMKVVSELKLPIEVHGIVGAVENMIGRHAYKPDDVLKARNGKTIEVRNTDAEGRLVLADCLCYAQDLKPDYIIDLATLTGACLVALGEYTIGVMGHNRNLKEELMKAAEDSGELTGDLPFNRHLSKLLKSEVADISNVSSSNYGGAITAGLFLSEFIEEKNKNKWAHLDIAGPAYLEKPWSYHPYGATGAGLRMIVNWIENFK